ncbi:MAG: uncharacterized protein JWM85_57, partial [Acidimicrobiaceae bacterium]|nr:uncharacterized protein [Acidimicrobiaceae bacterium]
MESRPAPIAESTGGDRAEASVDRHVVESARRLAEEVLFPGAAEVDASPLVPEERLDALAAAGLYGLVGPIEAGGLGAGPATVSRVLEELASGCLTTTFVFAQHHGTVRTIAGAGGELAARWLTPLCRGEVRSGVAFSGLRRPGTAAMVARESPDGFELTGSAPWVTGWGRIDVLHVAARTDDERVVWALLDAKESDSLSVEALRLGAVQASGTVSLRLEHHRVGAERVTLVEPLSAWQERDARGLATNGAHALGVARRCLALVGPGRLEDQLLAARERLDCAAPEELPGARAAAALLALRCAARLVAS